MFSTHFLFSSFGTSQQYLHFFFTRKQIGNKIHPDQKANSDSCMVGLEASDYTHFLFFSFGTAYSLYMFLYKKTNIKTKNTKKLQTLLWQILSKHVMYVSGHKGLFTHCYVTTNISSLYTPTRKQTQILAWQVWKPMFTLLSLEQIVFYSNGPANSITFFLLQENKI